MSADEEGRPATHGTDVDHQAPSTTTSCDASLVLDALDDAASRGWHTIMLHSVRPDGQGCTCDQRIKPCERKGWGKHPVDKGWRTATNAEVRAAVERRAKVWAVPNVGIMTGTASDLFVLDVDPDNGGDVTFAAMVAQHGDLPRTYEVRTGSGGTHYYFRQPEAGSPITNGRGDLPTGIDVRGEGGYVVMPPSVSGKGPYSPEDGFEVAEAPDWLLRILRPEPKRPGAPGPVADDVEGGVVTEAEANAWTDKAVSEELHRLDVMREKTTASADDYRGEPWDGTVFAVACNLIEVSNGNPKHYPRDRAYSDLFEHAPTDAGFGWGQIAAKWQSAMERSGTKARSATPGRRARSKPRELDDGAPNLLTDANLAQHVADRVLDGRFCWAGALGWMGWDGRRWAACTEVAVTEAVRLHVIDLAAVEARGGATLERRKALLSLQQRNRIGAMVALSKGIVLRDAAAFDLHPDLLNVHNGVVDLRTGALRPHDPALLLTRVTEVDYDADAATADLDAALGILPDDVMDYLQVRLGQACTGHMPPDDVLAVLVGGGSNGKTMLMGAVQHALGEHAVLVSDRVLLANPGDHPTEMMTLRGARLALIEETPEARTLDVARLKKVVGTPQITARLAHKDNVTWNSTHSLFITSNYRPVVSESDHGTWRRLALVRFPFKFCKPHEPLLTPTDRKGDAGLRQRMKASSSNQRAVLAWIVAGARRWYDADLVMPEPPVAVEADTLSWRKEADLVLAYIGDRLVFDQQWTTPAADLSADFTAYLEERGHKAWSERTFVPRFRDHDTVTAARVTEGRARPMDGDVSRSRHAPWETRVTLPSRFRCWFGVRFRTDQDEAADEAGTRGTRAEETSLTWGGAEEVPSHMSLVSHGSGMRS